MTNVEILTAEYLYDSFDGCPSCHASSVAEATDGALVAGCFAGSKESAEDTKVLISRKGRGAEHWETRVLWDEPGHAAGNVRLFRRPDGDLQIIYPLNFGAWCRGGSRHFQHTSADGGKTWSDQRPIPCERPFLGKNAPIQLQDGSLVLPVKMEGKAKEARQTSAALISTDGGDTWELSTEDIDSVDGASVIQPAAVELRSGDLLFLLRSDAGRIYRTTSGDGGRTWQPAQPTEMPNNHSGIDVVGLADGRFLLVCNPVAETWGPRSPLTVSISDDGGDTWCPLTTLEDQKGEYSYPTVIQTRDGLVHITYTYRRQRIKHVVLRLGT
ncbi:MAG: exo-alpha-sialidase [Lentisphaerae bacterium]|jgi:predicted neuraminidase|nr:exo-alpha-sialidase [Lentisphaerota bacterium]MBT4821213.1 exo-alpha-sialidase [Lentisphaerota bacterium]MBT5609675.1 exo-alpha-sialidase [Lentisphaerota bacterium]MBT7054799.1 exo-alpha-sialidase [Lentisphaerota bacterium]MBT7840908.1 exo-alpha-sialidase [Lentisphaerota bacterium]